jgi:hypothetical protein
VPRPKKAIPSVTKEISLPPDLVARVDLALYSELEDRVPHGAWQRLLTELLANWLARVEAARNQEP